MHRIDLGPHRLLGLGLFLVLSIATAEPGSAQLRSVRVASDLQRPVHVASPPGDPRLFILEQRGVVKILVNGAVLATPFLDIHDRVHSGGLQGLLGIAFHPDFAVNGFFYVNFTDLNDDSQIERYQVSANPDVADPGTRVPILSVDPPTILHNGGSMLFSPVDGYLYIATGDGGPEGDPLNNAQNTALLLGKLLRIDVDGLPPYEIPPDNPFVGVPGYREEIWAVGVRNPWGISLDPATGDIWMADVGEAYWEEIDLQPASSPGGENYGWRLMEGAHCYIPPEDCNDGSLTLPIFEYIHGVNGCSISGGHIYRGAIDVLEGSYFFTDYCSRRVWSIRYDGTQVVDFHDWSLELRPGGSLLFDEMVGVGADAAGEIYLIDRGDGNVDGEIYKVVLDPFSDAPQAQGTIAARLEAVHPSPSTGAVSTLLVLPRPAWVDLQVLDPAGRIVRDLAARSFPAGSTAVAWDGRDEHGRPMPTGIYFLRARVDGATHAQRAAILR